MVAEDVTQSPVENVCARMALSDRITSRGVDRDAYLLANIDMAGLDGGAMAMKPLNNVLGVDDEGTTCFGLDMTGVTYLAPRLSIERCLVEEDLDISAFVGTLD